MNTTVKQKTIIDNNIRRASTLKNAHKLTDLKTNKGATIAVSPSHRLNKESILSQKYSFVQSVESPENASISSENIKFD